MISRMACTAIGNIGLWRRSVYRVGSVSRFAMEFVDTCDGMRWDLVEAVDIL